jgi:paraquat-inducible protein B
VSNSGQIVSPEVPNSNLSNEEALKEMSMDHDFLPSAEEDSTPAEENESVEILKAATEADPPAAAEADQEWRHFIHQELEKLQNQEKVERNGMSKEASSSDQTFASMIKKIPVERMIDSAVRFLIEAKPNPTKKSKKSKK